jgi:hypothetical protein
MFPNLARQKLSQQNFLLGQEMEAKASFSA